MRIIRTVCGLTILAFAALPAFAQQPGTAVEAKAMLEKVVTDVKANKAKTLQDITAGTYNDKDLYPFCGGPDGKLTAHGAKKSLVGESLKDLKDPTGKAFGAEFYKVAQPGKLAEVAYMFPKPGGTTPEPKESYITKVDDQVCGVGYYK